MKYSTSGVKNVKAVSSTDKINITWDTSSSLSKYYIYRSQKSDATFDQIGEATTGNYDDLTAASGKTYYYKVRGYSDIIGYMAFSDAAYGFIEGKLTFDVTSDGYLQGNGFIWYYFDGIKDTSYKINFSKSS